MGTPLTEWNRAPSDRKTLQGQVSDEDSAEGFLLSVRGDYDGSIVPPKNARLPAEGQYVVLPVSDKPKKRVLGWFQVSSVKGSPSDGVVLSVVAALPPPWGDEDGSIFSTDKDPDQAS